MKALGRAGLILQKHLPEIMVGAGVVGVIGSTVLACKATLKAQDILDEYEDHIHTIEDAKLVADQSNGRVCYEESAEKEDRMRAKVNLVRRFVIEYAPAAALLAVSIFAIVKGHQIRYARGMAAVAAYTAVDGANKAYRRKVIEKLGKEEERKLRYGYHEEEVDEVNEQGEVTGTKKVAKVNPNDYSPYARIFDESNKYWEKDAEYNLMFLKRQQQYWNDKLKSRGHVFLNEVYDSIGFEHTAEGALVGWVYEEGRENFIDFGMMDLTRERAIAFINGLERSIILDFNVDGCIYDII